MKDNVDIQAIIRGEFPKMETQEDLLALMNKVKRYLEKGSNEDFIPLIMQSLNYYKNIKTSGERRYKTFSIKKKSGALRTISAPCTGLKVFQYCLNYMLQTLYQSNPNACGFVPGRSIADGAKKHVGKKYVLNIDLKDFFDTIEHHRVKAIFTLPPFNLKDDKENPNSLPYLLANLCCHPKEVTRFDKDGNPYQCVRNVTPQGAPTSPMITNLICRQLDRRLLGLAKRFKVSYSRYADDITFSSNNKDVFEEVSAFRVELKRIIEEDQKFRINEEKTRVQSRAYRQEVTGLVVNNKVNVTKRYVKQIRMWLYLWERYGYNKASEQFQKDYNRYKGQAQHGTNMENVIGGKLNYMKMIVGADNAAYRKLAERFEKLTKEFESGINVSDILDVWENDGIEEAIESNKCKTDESNLSVDDYIDKLIKICSSSPEAKKKIKSLLDKLSLNTNTSSQLVSADQEKQDLLENNKGLYHDPEFVSRFLHQFTEKDCQALKFTTHYWDKDSEGKYNYDSFAAFKEAYLSILLDKSKLDKLDGYKELYPFVIKKGDSRSSNNITPMDVLNYRCEHLWQLIRNFLVNDDAMYPWGEHKLRIGYNEYLKKWMDENIQQQPFSMPLSLLPQELIPQKLINGKQLYDFGDVVELFKHCIEFRDDDLYRAVRTIFKSSDINVDKDLLSTLKGCSFYTDTFVIKEALRVIAGNIHQRTEHPNVEISCVTKEEANRKRISLEILQIDSYSYRDVNDAKIDPDNNEGDLATIKNKLRNLCDFSVESFFKDNGVVKPLRINYLLSSLDQYQKIEDIDEKSCVGFKYILHFYNYKRKRIEEEI